MDGSGDHRVAVKKESGERNDHADDGVRAASGSDPAPHETSTTENDDDDESDSESGSDSEDSGSNSDHSTASSASSKSAQSNASSKKSDEGSSERSDASHSHTPAERSVTLFTSLSLEPASPDRPLLLPRITERKVIVTRLMTWQMTSMPAAGRDGDGPHPI